MGPKGLIYEPPILCFCLGLFLDFYFFLGGGRGQKNLPISLPFQVILNNLTKKLSGYLFLGGGGFKKSQKNVDQFSPHFRQFWTTLIFSHVQIFIRTLFFFGGGEGVPHFFYHLSSSYTYLDVQTKFQTPTVLRKVKFRLVRYLCHTDSKIMNAGVAFASVEFSVELGLVRSVGISVGQAS